MTTEVTTEKRSGKTRKAQIKRLHHITLRVKNFKAAVEKWSRIFDKPPDRFDIKEEWGYQMAFFNAGNCWIVLLDDFGLKSINESHVRVMKACPPTHYGFFHMALLTDDIDTLVGEMTDAGVNLWDKTPVNDGYLDSRYSWIDPADTTDALVHLYEAVW